MAARHLRFLVLALFCATCFYATALVLRHRVSETSNPLAQHVYVWQRAWTPPVVSAFAEYATNFGECIVLGAEVSWRGREPSITRVAMNYHVMQYAAGPVGIALRIGNFSGPFSREDERIRRLRLLASELLLEAKTNRVAVTELQIDFDCAETKLDGYRLWVEALKQAVAPIPVTITALPAWLNRPAFRRLIDTADGYVLQVHSLERPRSSHAPFVLCDPTAAKRAVRKAARLRRPFRVALPTYGYLVAFDSAGKFAGLAAEGPAPEWPDEFNLREVRADATALAVLIADWTSTHPAALQGIIWYRLPVKGERLNWSWPTLVEVMAGRIPAADVRVETRAVPPGLVEIDLVNVGHADSSLPPFVKAHWTGGQALAADALGGFEIAARRPNTLLLSTRNGKLSPGARRTIGWIRLATDTEVKVELTTKAH